MSKEEKSFEEKLSELEVIVKELESGNVDLDNAINKYTEAMKIARKNLLKFKSSFEDGLAKS